METEPKVGTGKPGNPEKREKQVITETKVRDKWDKTDILIRSLGTLLIPVTLTAISLVASYTLNRNQEKEAKIKLYTELMTRREESESTLRKDMFNAIMSNILKDRGTALLDDKILQLELLTYNFHESLNLMPLFEYLDRINKEKTTDPELKKMYKNRLVKMAKAVTEKQMSSLEGVSDPILFFFQDTLAPYKNSKDYNKDDAYRAHIDELASINAYARNLKSPNQEETEFRHPDSVYDGKNFIPLQYNVRIKIIDYDTGNASARVQLSILTYDKDKLKIGERTKEFTINFFEFPMIDNTRLENDMRVALVMTSFGGECGLPESPLTASRCTRIEFRVIFFPGAKASLKERPYFDDIVSKLVMMK